jgi:ureidoglycolate hydrolase
MDVGSFVNELQSESFANFGAYMSRNFSSTVFVLAQKQFSINLGSISCYMYVLQFQQNRSTPNITLVSTAVPYTSQTCGKYWR